MSSSQVESSVPQGTRPKKDLRFWFIMLALSLTLFLSALEATAVSTALPTILSVLHGSDFAWVGSAYALASAATIPMTGGLAQIFGRKPSLLAFIAIFAVGSAVCGAATDMTMLIAGRVVQGIGGGGILSFANIILADLVSLEERGLYAGLFGLTWSVAASIGPVVGGGLADSGQWRWLFYLNLPLCGVSAALAFAFLNLPTPPGTLQEKLSRMDWVGNIIIIGSACSITIALTQGGVNSPWSSAKILVPLIVGVVGTIGFIIYEALVAKNPLVPVSILSNRTSFSGYMQTFLLPVATFAAIYYIPVYFQAATGASAIHAGVLSLGLSALAPAALITGISVRTTQRYRPQIWIAWILQIIGAALLTLIKLDTVVGAAVGYCAIFGVGSGMNYSAQIYPVLAPLPVSANAHAIAFFAFMRSFAGVWGVTLGGAILQNELQRRLPQQFLAQFPQGVAIVYSVIPQIKNLPESERDQVRQAFIDSLNQIWIALAVVSAAGFLVSLLMRGLPLPKFTDENWAPVNKEQSSELRPMTKPMSIESKRESSASSLPQLTTSIQA